MGAIKYLTGGADVAEGGLGLGKISIRKRHLELRRQKGCEWSGVGVLLSEGIALVKALRYERTRAHSWT